MLRKFTLVLAAFGLSTSIHAQTDTIPRNRETAEADTIRVGGIVIVKKEGKDDEIEVNDAKIPKRRNYKPSNVSTNWWIFDLGLANFTDNTDYASAGTQAFAPGATEDWFDLRNGKSVNVNIWFFQQRLNVIKHVLNLKYGLGMELNNYRWQESIIFEEKPTTVVLDNNVSFKKNKLAADYLTVPFMLNFNFTPDRKKGFGLSAGVSAGYLYASRQKFVGGGQGKRKVKDDFELEPWKLSYIGEIQLGPVKLYGSYATKSMFKKGLDFTPYNVGFRFSNW